MGKWTLTSTNRRRAALRAARERGLPGADVAGVAVGRMRELERQRVRVLRLADVIPIEDELAQFGVPVRRLRGEIGLGEVGRRGMREREERGTPVVPVTGPPADLDLLRVSPVPHDEAR